MGEREWDGIWIPKDIYLSKDISHTAKMIFLEIHSFTSRGRECFVSNAHLSDFVGVSERMVTKCIAELIDKGWIEQISFDGRRRFLQSCYEEKFRTPMKKAATEGRTKVPGSTEEKFQHTSNNIPEPETSNKDKGEEASSSPSDYSICMDIYYKFFKNFIGLPPKITGADGKALKQIVAHLKNLPGDHPPGELLQLIFDNWKLLDNFTQQQTSLIKINHSFNEIITQLRKQRKSKSDSLHADLDDYADALRKQE